MSLDTPARPRAVRAAGIALIVAPILALVVKSFSFGWMMALLLMLVIPVLLLVLGYALQLVIALGSLLRHRGALRHAANTSRAVSAAWVTSIGAVLTALLMYDGGDQTAGSTLTLMLGMASDGQAESVSGVVTLVTGAVWLGGWVWLVVEWLIALAQRRRAAA